MAESQATYHWWVWSLQVNMLSESNRLCQSNSRCSGIHRWLCERPKQIVHIPSLWEQSYFSQRFKDTKQPPEENLFIMPLADVPTRSCHSQKLETLLELNHEGESWYRQLWTLLMPTTITLVCFSCHTPLHNIHFPLSWRPTLPLPCVLANPPFGIYVLQSHFPFAAAPVTCWMQYFVHLRVNLWSEDDSSWLERCAPLRVVQALEAKNLLVFRKFPLGPCTQRHVFDCMMAKLSGMLGDWE
jgi:hypothetical protein